MDRPPLGCFNNNVPVNSMPTSSYNTRLSTDEKLKGYKYTKGKLAGNIYGKLKCLTNSQFKQQQHLWIINASNKWI